MSCWLGTVFLLVASCEHSVTGFKAFLISGLLVRKWLPSASGGRFCFPFVCSLEFDCIWQCWTWCMGLSHSHSCRILGLGSVLHWFWTQFLNGQWALLFPSCRVTEEGIFMILLPLPSSADQGVHHYARLAACFSQEIFNFLLVFSFPEDKTFAGPQLQAGLSPGPLVLQGLITSSSQHSRQCGALGCSPHSGSLRTPHFTFALQASSHLSL